MSKESGPQLSDVGNKITMTRKSPTGRQSQGPTSTQGSKRTTTRIVENCCHVKVPQAASKLTNPVKVLGRARMAAASEKCASSCFCKSLYRTLYGKSTSREQCQRAPREGKLPEWLFESIFTWVLANFASCPPRASPRSVDQRANERGQSVQAQSFQSLRPPVVAVTPRRSRSYLGLRPRRLPRCPHQSCLHLR